MLTYFSVQGFRNFKDKLEFDLRSTNKYEFNTHALKNGTVNHSVIYGENGSGKSNVGLAILDIVSHVIPDSTVQINTLKDNFLNADTDEQHANFEYEFEIEGHEVVYRYGKTDDLSLVYESLHIDKQLVAEINRDEGHKAFFDLDGSENLKTDISRADISIIRYLSMSVLDETRLNYIFDKFIEFVGGMVFFRSLNRTEYQGQRISSSKLSDEIIGKGKVQEFEKFLNEVGVNFNLDVQGASDDQYIVFKYRNKTIEFSRIASTGTLSLGIFYYWYLQLCDKKIKFAFIDEFDAFYHFELSRKIVNKLSELECQTVLTTHNLSLLDNDLLRPDCYFEVSDNKIVPFSSLVHKELRKAHNIEKIYRGMRIE